MNYLKATENTVTIVSAFLSNNIVPASDVPNFIGQVHQAITGLQVPEVAAIAKQEPAVSTRASVKPDHIVCIECGQKHKMLRRHINQAHNMTEHEYRAKWSLPSDYPMVAPNYSEKRRGLAIQNGLGRKAKG